MEDITNGWNKLSLFDRERGEFKFQAQHKSQEFSIVAKFFTSRALNVEAVARTFNPTWRSKNGFQIQNLGDHQLLFIFENKSDVERFYAMSLGALISMLLYYSILTKPFRCVMWCSRKQSFGFKCMTYQLHT